MPDDNYGQMIARGHGHLFRAPVYYYMCLRQKTSPAECRPIIKNWSGFSREENSAVFILIIVLQTIETSEYKSLCVRV